MMISALAILCAIALITGDHIRESVAALIVVAVCLTGLELMRGER
jgi:hypothetical protein